MAQSSPNAQRSAPRRHFRLKKNHWAVLYFFIGGGIPLLTFLLEFVNIQPDKISGGVLDRFPFCVITAYSPLFLYACIGGFLLPLYIIPAYDYLKSVELNDRIHRVRKRLVKAAFGLSIIVAFSDFYGGAYAIWEVRPPYHSGSISHFMNADSIAKKAKKNDSIEDQFLAAQKKYKIEIATEIIERKHPSFTRYTYFFSVLIEAFFLICYFFLCFLYQSLQRPLKEKDQDAYFRQIGGLTISNLLIWFWLILRAMNSAEKEKLYPDADLQVANISVAFCNIACLLAIFISSLNDKKMQKVAEITIGIIAGLGISIGSVVGYFNSDKLVLFWGKNASIYNYVVFPFFIIFIYAVYFMNSLAKEFTAQRYPPSATDPNSVDNEESIQ